MPTGMPIDQSDVAFANRLADAAGAAIRPYFRASAATEIKADHSPVTLADRAAETAIRALITSERPDDGIIGEEFGSERGDAHRVWVIDPIDGTRSFIGGRPIFGTLIALMENNVPVIGIIDQPITRERWIGARGAVTLFNGIPCVTRPCPDLASAIQATTSPAAFPPADWPPFERTTHVTCDTLWGGDCYNYGLVALGQIDLVIEAGMKLHDFAALVPVVEGAGGAMCDWDGAPLSAHSDGRVIAVGDATLIPHVRAMLQSA